MHNHPEKHKVCSKLRNRVVEPPIEELPDVAKFLTKSLAWRQINNKTSGFVQGGHVEVFRLASLYRYNLIDHIPTFFNG